MECMMRARDFRSLRNWPMWAALSLCLSMLLTSCHRGSEAKAGGDSQSKSNGSDRTSNGADTGGQKQGGKSSSSDGGASGRGEDKSEAEVPVAQCVSTLQTCNGPVFASLALKSGECQNS